MDRRVIWSKRSQNDRKEIFRYWNKRNKSNAYSKKLNKLFKEAIRLIAEYPKIGKITDDKSIRIKIVKDYLLIYETDDQQGQLVILTIWDSRQDPEKVKRILQE